MGLGGRPTDEGVARTSAARVRLTPLERSRLDALALRLGTTRARLVRRAIREMTTRGPDFFDDGLIGLSETTRELAAVGRNLNQIAAKLNSGDRAYPSDIANVVREVARTVHELQTAYRTILRNAATRWMPAHDDSRAR